MEVKVVRYELYPKDEPIGYVVGFNVTCSTGRNFYRDLVMNFTEIGSELPVNDEEVVRLAWTKIKEEVETRIIEIESKKNIIGSVINSDGTLFTDPITTEEPLIAPEEPSTSEPVV